MMFNRIGRTMAGAVAAALALPGALALPIAKPLPFYLHRDIGGGAQKPDHTRVRGKTYPQHGARECARRVRQMQAAKP